MKSIQSSLFLNVKFYLNLIVMVNSFSSSGRCFADKDVSCFVKLRFGEFFRCEWKLTSAGKDAPSDRFPLETVLSWSIRESCENFSAFCFSLSAAMRAFFALCCSTSSLSIRTLFFSIEFLRFSASWGCSLIFWVGSARVFCLSGGLQLPIFSSAEKLAQALASWSAPFSLAINKGRIIEVNTLMASWNNDSVNLGSSKAFRNWTTSTPEDRYGFESRSMQGYILLLSDFSLAEFSKPKFDETARSNVSLLASRVTSHPQSMQWAVSNSWTVWEWNILLKRSAIEPCLCI